MQQYLPTTNAMDHRIDRNATTKARMAYINTPSAYCIKLPGAPADDLQASPSMGETISHEKPPFAAEQFSGML
jgi:hypothetical protein